MPITPATLVQLAILAAGTYFLLGFLRTTRGTGLVRGLSLALLVGFFGLYLVALRFELEELKQIIEVSGGYAMVVLAIIFQPELRRGIVHLGENPLLGRLIEVRRREVVPELCKAVEHMAGKRQGALIAIERRTRLDAYIDRGVRVDARLNRFLLDSIFHHGSALHDGAVVLRGDRVAGAGCLFPLTENPEVSKSTGTRHRAALGITEETDALAIAVSEETGDISFCVGGEMRRGVGAGELQELLRARLGAGETAAQAPRRRRGPREYLAADFWRIVGALAMACGLYLTAHQNIRHSETFELRIVSTTSDEVIPEKGILAIVLPDRSYHLAAPPENSILRVEVSGTRGEIEALDEALGGVLPVDPTGQRVDQSFPLAQVRWGPARWNEQLAVRIDMDSPPRLVVESHTSWRVALEARHLDVDTEELSVVYRPLFEEVEFTPATVEIVGPPGRIEELKAGRLPLALETVRIPGSHGDRHYQTVGLAKPLREQGLSLTNGWVEVSLPIVPSEYEFGSLEREIRLVALSGDRSAVERWTPPSSKARFRVVVRGFIPADLDPSSEAFIEHSSRVLLFLEDHLRAFVDVSQLGGGDGSQATILWCFTTPWENELRIHAPGGGEHLELKVALIGDQEVFLSPKAD